MTTQPTWEPGSQTGMPTLVPLLSQLPLEFPPKPTIRKAVASFSGAPQGACVLSTNDT